MEGFSGRWPSGCALCRGVGAQAVCRRWKALRPGSETRTQTIPGSGRALQAHHTSQQLSHDFKCGLNNELHLPVFL